MTRICWWLVDELERLLEPEEREAVRGDVAESGETGRQALCDVLGLIVRRQATFWKGWRPWLVLVGLVAPVGLTLSLSFFSLDRLVDLYLWIFRNYGTLDPTILAETGLTAHRGIVHLISGSLLLGSWSWISGFALGSLSRRTIWVNGTLFCIVVISVFASISANRRYHYDVSGGVFSLTFYTLIFPMMLQAILVLFPAFWGMRHGGCPLVRRK
jgi:hypothetical protein